jgi:hypothetical protein
MGLFGKGLTASSCLHLYVLASYSQSKAKCDESDCWCWVVNRAIVNKSSQKRKHSKRCKELATVIRVKNSQRVVDLPLEWLKHY